MTYFVAVTDAPSADDLAIERSVLTGMQVERISWKDPHSLAEATREADAILCMHAPFDRKVVYSLSRCKIIARFGTGLDNIDRQAAAEKNIEVAGVHDYCTEEVANHTLALLLAWNRKIQICDEFVRDKRWNEKALTTGNWGMPPIQRLSAQTLGIIGFGRIGQAVAKRALGFGMTVLVGRRHEMERGSVHSAMENTKVEVTNWEDLLRRSDYVSLHLPLTDTTRNLISSESIKMMKNGAVLINTSRGGLVDEDALIAGLRSGHLGGALLDVYQKAPLPVDHSLRATKNLILSPHVAFYSEESLLDLRRLAAEAVRDRLTLPR